MINIDLIRSYVGRPWEEGEASAFTCKVTHARIYNEKSAHTCAQQGFINRI